MVTGNGNDPLNLIGKQLGDYKIERSIGQGGMARIYKGYDDKLERYAAIKIFDAQGVASDELDEYRQRFMREARAIARLRHPNIVSVYQTGTYEDLNYMAMMFIEGRDLRYVLKEHVAHSTRMSKVDILRIISDIASALDYAHREGVIHRDVKPSNIMIMADGHAILTDFGLALSIPEGTIGTTFGSVHYIAPEQATSSALAVPQSDLYSLGVVLYEMLTGKVPFDDASAMSVALKHLSEPPPPPTMYNTDISPEVEVMVLKALDKDAGKRYQTGAAFIAALENAFGMTDEDEMTRRLMALPEWATNPQMSHLTIPQVPADESKPSGLNASQQREMVYATGREKTITDPSATSRPVGTQTSRSRTPFIMGAVAALLIGVIGLVALTGGDGLLGGILAAPTDTPTATATHTPTETEAPTSTSTSTATATPPPASPTATDDSAGVIVPPVDDDDDNEDTEATATPTHTPTTRPSATPVTPTQPPIPSPDEAQVVLRYDFNSLVLFNRSAADVNISGLTFVQNTAEGGELTFLSLRWGGGSRPITALPAGDCFQVWTFDDNLLDQPAYCSARHAWRQVGPRGEFWRSDVPGAVFSVRRGETVLAECSIEAGECYIDLTQ